MPRFWRVTAVYSISRDTGGYPTAAELINQRITML